MFNWCALNKLEYRGGRLQAAAHWSVVLSPVSLVDLIKMRLIKRVELYGYLERDPFYTGVP